MRRQDVIYENGADRRVGVGAIVVMRSQGGGRRKRLAISNLTNNSAIGDSINGTAVPTEDDGAFFAVFLTRGCCSPSAKPRNCLVNV